MIDISAAGLQFRGAPVTLMSEGVETLLYRCGESVETGLTVILHAATDTAELEYLDGSGCIFRVRAGGETVWIERFGCTFEDGHHEGGAWSVFLPSER